MDQRATEKWSLAGMLSGISQDFLLEIASFSPVHADSLQNSNFKSSHEEAVRQMWWTNVRESCSGIS